MIRYRLKNLFYFFTKRKKNRFKLPKRNKKILEKLLGYPIADETYYIKALTHKSFLDIEPALKKSNQRLEFLGDSVLNLIVSEILFKIFPDEDEGFLTKIRSHLVDTDSLTECSNRLGLHELVFAESKFREDSLKKTQKIFADSLEALFGAIYLDKGLSVTKRMVEKWIVEPNLKSGRYQVDKNFKGQLLELTHKRKLTPPEYVLVSVEGPEHDLVFTIDVLIEGKRMGRGKERNKKAAEQAAAKEAFNSLLNE